jgi:hypothetical protein
MPNVALTGTASPASAALDTSHAAVITRALSNAFMSALLVFSSGSLRSDGLDGRVLPWPSFRVSRAGDYTN